jgi:GNAT superfamily N-acetyltransferase
LGAPAITNDYTPGALARLIEMHAGFYAREWGFGLYFETKVAREAAEFLGALPQADSQAWFARDGERIVGSIAIDGRHAAADGAHLRWFVVDDSVRGAGAGAALLDAALAFCRARKFSRVYLWTFAGLDAARRLYEARGFRLVEEREARSWGVVVREQRFDLEGIS